MSEKATEPALVLREPDGSYTAIIDLAQRATLTVEAPTWRSFHAALRSCGYSLGRMKESEIQDGLGVLEKALR